MRKLTLIFIIIAMAVAAPLFAAGGKEKAETVTVTIWHSAQGANATLKDGQNLSLSGDKHSQRHERSR